MIMIKSDICTHLKLRLENAAGRARWASELRTGWLGGLPCPCVCRTGKLWLLSGSPLSLWGNQQGK
jgi:hypothetical protein